MHRFAVSMNVHEKDSRLLPEKVVVQSRDFKSVIKQRRHNRIHLILGKDQVAHHHIIASVTFRQGEPTSKAERGWNAVPCDLHMQVIPRNIHFQHIRFVVAGFADNLQNLLVIAGNLLRVGSGRRRNDC